MFLSCRHLLDKYCKGEIMRTKQLSLDELLELIELENLPTAQEEKNDVYYAYLRIISILL
jgi:hypothetical protein